MLSGVREISTLLNCVKKQQITAENNTTLQQYNNIEPHQLHFELDTVDIIHNPAELNSDKINNDTTDTSTAE